MLLVHILIAIAIVMLKLVLALALLWLWFPFRLLLLRLLLKSQRIYNICSAIRGPDYRDFRVKCATTAIVRNRLWISPFWVGPAVQTNKDCYNHCHVRTGLSGHFAEHQREAFEALGLIWELNNDTD